MYKLQTQEWIVHFRSSTAKKAPCGYEFQKHLLGLDFARTWNKKIPVPVNCPACRKVHSPKRHEFLLWQNVKRKVKL